MYINEIDIQDFEFIWDNWVEPSIKKIAEQMDAEFKTQTNFKVRDLSKIKNSANKYFVNKREHTKKEFYGSGSSNKSEKHFMDFHKLSAVLCRTLIENKVYEFDVTKCIDFIENKKIESKNTDWLVHNALVNFRLAFYASVVFLYQSMLFRLKSEDLEKYNKLKNLKKLNLYTFEKNGYIHESFENSLVLDLAKRDINDHSFDCFLYATIMYQLEEYNLQLLK